jgi:hypothetical protein
MTNKFTKIYDTVIETQDLVQRQELHEGYFDDAWEGMGADDLNRTLNLVGMGGAALTTGLYAASATPLAPIAAPAAAIASGLTNLYDLGVGSVQAARASMEDDPELKNKMWQDSVWNFTSAIPLAGDVAQLARAGKVAGMPLIKQMKNIPGADKALAATSKLSSMPAQLGTGVIGAFGSGPIADVISPAPKSNTVANKGDEDSYKDLEKQLMYSRMPGIGEYSRLANNPSRPMGFATRQPLIAHMERIAKGAAQNLMEQGDADAEERLAKALGMELEGPGEVLPRDIRSQDLQGADRPADVNPSQRLPGQRSRSATPAFNQWGMPIRPNLDRARPVPAPPPLVNAAGGITDAGQQALERLRSQGLPGADRLERALAGAIESAADGKIAKNPKGPLGLLNLLTPFAVAGGAAMALPAFYGRRGQEVVPPEGVPPLGAPGTGNLTGGISNAIERLQGVAGGAAQFAQYMPPGVGELGRRAAMMAAGRMA